MSLSHYILLIDYIIKIDWSVVNMDKEVLESLKTLVKNQKDLITEIKE